MSLLVILLLAQDDLLSCPFLCSSLSGLALSRTLVGKSQLVTMAMSFPVSPTQGINGGYYSAALQQAHSTTPHEAPHSAMPPSVAQSQAVALPVSAVTAPPAGIGHGLVSKSVSWD